MSNAALYLVYKNKKKKKAEKARPKPIYNRIQL